MFYNNSFLTIDIYKLNRHNNTSKDVESRKGILWQRVKIKVKQKLKKLKIKIKLKKLKNAIN